MFLAYSEREVLDNDEVVFECRLVDSEFEHTWIDMYMGYKTCVLDHIIDTYKTKNMEVEHNIIRFLTFMIKNAGWTISTVRYEMKQDYLVPYRDDINRMLILL